ncbi:MAG: hypothetical protein KF784_09170 [Fimbriimonadaceae bacterium]|nr:hypothetical protein [Fimbriimonadaceae bacterium]
MKKLIALFCVAIATCAYAGPAPDAKTAFEALKKLEGSWAGKMDGGMEAKVIYKLTGGGSALVETLAPGTEYEMVSVYHLDNNDLLMTHYCAAGNQPTMKYKPGKDTKTIDFEFLRGSNMKASDMHMHSLTIKMISDDKMECNWTSYDKGKAAGTAKFEYTRVK